MEMTAQEFCSVEFAQTWQRAGLNISDLNSACEVIRPVFWLGDASLYSAILSIVYIIMVFILSKFAGTDRSKLSSVFSFLVPFSLFFVSGSTVVQGGIFTYSIYAVQVNTMGSWFPVVTLGLGLGALIVALSVIKSAMSISRQVTMTQMAIDANEKEYPDLWKFVREIANKVDAPVPNNIAIGLEPTFYATSANVKVLSSDKSLSGETLYISLPLMRLFSKEEFGAVVGHELGHFKGSDVQYTMKFAPLYRALSTAVSNTADQGKIMAIPALSVLGFLLTRFAESEREISRQREFEADRVGATATSENALCAALIKVTAFSNFWGDLTYDLIENLEFGRPVKNLSKLYASRVAFDTDADASRTVVQQNLDYKVSHPTDTHPTLSDRLKNLNASDDFTSLDMGFLDDSSLTLIKDAEVLETELTLVQQKVYQVTGIAHYESKKPDNAEAVYGVARIIQTAAAVMVCADGEVQPSEISEAEDKGKNMVSHFNSLEFRELCLSSETLPTVSELSKMMKEIFSKENLTQLTEFLTSIAESDGNISPEEKKFISSLKI